MLEAELQIKPEEHMKDYVARRINHIISQRDITFKSLGSSLYELMGLSPASATIFSCDVSNGYWCTSKNKLNPNTKGGQKTAHRLSILFKALGIEENDDLIDIVRGHYGDVFQYPPDCSIPYIRYEDLKRTHRKTLTSDEVEIVSKYLDKDLRNLDNLTKEESNKLNSLWFKLHGEIHPNYRK